jgi:hypothetical protein
MSSSSMLKTSNDENNGNEIEKEYVQTIIDRYGTEIIEKTIANNYKNDNESDNSDSDRDEILISSSDDENDENKNKKLKEKVNLCFRNYEPHNFKLKKYKKRYYTSLDKKSNKYFHDVIDRNQVLMKQEIENLLMLSAKQTQLPSFEDWIDNENLNNENDFLFTSNQSINQDLKKHVESKLNELDIKTNQSLQKIMEKQMEESDDDESDDDEDDDESDNDDDDDKEEE